jgi:D-alanine-D-alanine ligase
MPTASLDQRQEQLRALEQCLIDVGADLSVFLVYDRPHLGGSRHGLARTYFKQRCLSDAEISAQIAAFRDIGAWVEMFEGEHPLLTSLGDGRLLAVPRSLKVIYNGINNYVSSDGFEPGRKALLPAIADSYGLVCSNSNAYACALGRHKFHYLTVLGALGIRTPRVWYYSDGEGWAAKTSPEPGTKVIVKSTYESWSVGVTDESVFVVDSRLDKRVAAIALEIGQAVTVQEFVSGHEVNVPVLTLPQTVAMPPVEAVLAKAPGDADAFVTITDNMTNRGLQYKAFDAPTEIIEPICKAALEVFTILELRAFGRVDFRVDANGDAWVIDVGVEPGLSVEGSASTSFAQLDFTHASFLRLVIAAALASRGLLNSHAKAQSPEA